MIELEATRRASVRLSRAGQSRGEAREALTAPERTENHEEVLSGYPESTPEIDA